jgi:hypothetical protein
MRSHMRIHPVGTIIYSVPFILEFILVGEFKDKWDAINDGPYRINNYTTGRLALCNRLHRLDRLHFEIGLRDSRLPARYAHGA